MPTSHKPNLPAAEQIAIAREVRQRLLQASQNTAPIQALAELIGFGSVTFRIQDHRVIRAAVEVSEKMAPVERRPPFERPLP